MFNTTHTLVGLALARTGLDKWTRSATWTAVIASNLPDIDIMTQLESSASYIEYHRGVTHSLVGVPILSLLLAAVMWKLAGNFGRHFLIALLAMATHPMLDYANTYGIRPFLPFDPTWFYGDTLFVIDPYLDALLLAGIIGGRFFKARRQITGITALVAVLVYVGIRIELRDMAQTRMAEFSPGVRGFHAAAVSPRMLTPRIFTGLVETEDAVFSVRVDAFYGVTRELVRIPKQSPLEITSRAGTARSASAFLGFARFPVVQIKQLAPGYRVMFIDFRFYRESTGTAFAAEVWLDGSLRVVRDTLGFNQRVN